MAFIYDLSDTWNNAGISFSGIKINVTDSASAAGSKLLDLQIGSASKFTVGKTGTVIATGLIESTTGGFRFPDGTTQTTKATVNSVSGTGTVNGITLTGTVTDSGSLTLGGTLGNIANSQLTNSAITINGTSTALGGSISVGTVTSVAGTGTVNGLTLTGTVTTSGSLTLGGTLGNIANSQLTNSAITINGTSTALGGSISVGTVTSVAALTLGTSGTDLASSVANGTTTPVITLNVPTASASNRGALSSSDWSTFNAKQAALVSGTNIKTVGGASLLGSGDVGTIGLAYGGTGATTQSGARTALGLGTAAVLNAGVAGGVATLDGSGTVPTSQLPGAVLGGLNYQGTWNASTNTPTLASSTGSKGYYYVVSVAGSTNLDGITDWKIGDWAVYDGTAWQKVDNTDAVSSVNGFTGAVVLTTSDVAQGTNLYFTQAAARGSVSAGTGISYDSGTGVITNSAPDQTVALTGAGTTVVTGTYPNFTITSNDSTVGTVTSVGGTGTVNGITLTGTVTSSGSLTLGGTLSGVDLTSQVTGTLPVANGGTGATTLSSGYLVKGNGTSAVSASLVYDTGTNVGIGTTTPAALLSISQNGGGDIGALVTQTNSGNGTTGRYRATHGSGAEINLEAGNGYTAVKTTSASPLGLYTSDTERMHITSAGLVGIGTSSPAVKLDVVGAGVFKLDGSGSTTPLILRNNNTASVQAVKLGFDSNGAIKASINAAVYGNDYMTFNVGSDTERMRIDASGNVTLGIGGGAKTVLYNDQSIASINTAGSAYTDLKVDGLNLLFRTGSGSTAERMRITSAGDVGIGTAAPGVKLDVVGPDNSGAQYRTSTRTIGIGSISGVNALYGGSGTELTFHIGSERMRIDSSGQVGIGTGSAPLASKVVIEGTLGTTASQIQIVGTGVRSGYIGPSSNGLEFGTDSGGLLFRTGVTGNASVTTGTERMRIDADGNVLINRSGTSGIGKLNVEGGADVTSGNVTIQAGYGLAWRGDQTRIMTPEDNVVGALINWGAGGGCRFISGTSERMRIDGGGLVGIGTSSPFTTLDVSGAGVGGTGWVGRFGNTSTVGVLLGVRGGVASIGGQDVANINLQPDGGNVGIGTSSPAQKLDVGAGGNVTLSGGSTGDQFIRVGSGRSGNGYSYIDLQGDATYSNGLRMIRTNGGANSSSNIEHRGTGQLQMITQEAAPITFLTSATERMRIDSSGNLLVGTTSATGAKVDVYNSGSGDATVRIGNAQNALTTDVGKQGATAYGANAAGDGFLYSSTNLSIMSDNGAGVIKFSTGGNAERARIDSSGNLLVGTTSSGYSTSGRGVIEVNGSSNSIVSLKSGGNTTGYMYASYPNFFIANSASGPTVFENGGAEKMRIDSSGNVGIGVNNPGAYGNRLGVGSPSDTSTNRIGILTQYATCTLIADGATAAAGAQLDASWANGGQGPLRFTLTGSEKMRIDASGNLLVGKSSLSDAVTTDGAIFYKNASGGGMVTYLTNGGTGTVLAVSTQGDTGAVIFYRSNTQVGSISVTSSATAYNTSSDYRLKDIDGPVVNSGAYIDALKPVQGSWKADGSRFIGLLAHEVQEVSETPIATGEKDGEEMQAMDYSAPELIANLIAEIQSLRARVAQLEGN